MYSCIRVDGGMGWRTAAAAAWISDKVVSAVRESDGVSALADRSPPKLQVYYH